MLGTGQLRQRRRADRRHPVPVAALPMQQRGRSLDQALPHPPFVSLNYRTPDGFQGFVCEPELAAVEQVSRVRQLAPARLGGQAPIRSRLTAPWHALTVPTRTMASSVDRAASATIRSPSNTDSTANVPTP